MLLDRDKLPALDIRRSANEYCNNRTSTNSRNSRSRTTAPARRKIMQVFPINSQGLMRQQTGMVKAVNNVSFDLMPGAPWAWSVNLVAAKQPARTITARLTPTSGSVHFQADGGALIAAVPGETSKHCGHKCR